MQLNARAMLKAAGACVGTLRAIRVSGGAAWNFGNAAGIADEGLLERARDPYFFGWHSPRFEAADDNRRQGPRPEPGNTTVLAAALTGVAYPN